MSAKYFFNPHSMGRLVREELTDLVRRTQVEFIRIIKHVLSQPGRGKMEKGLAQPRSLPGHPPAVQTGMLRASWGVMRPPVSSLRGVKGSVHQRNMMSLGTVSPVQYAIYLDRAKKKKNRRPFVDRSTKSTVRWMIGRWAKVNRPRLINTINSITSFGPGDGDYQIK